MNRCVSVYYVLLRSLGISRRVNTRDVRAKENKMIRKKERRGKFTNVPFDFSSARLNEGLFRAIVNPRILREW